MFPRPRSRIRIFQKGVIRYLILESLCDRPMHGYELMKALGENFEGLFQPSAGAIYPTLQTLQDEGYITTEETEGKKTHTITQEGREFLKKSEERFKTIIENRKAFLSERRELNREIRNLASLIFTNYRDLEKQKTDAVAQVLKEARIKISEIIFE